MKYKKFPTEYWAKMRSTVAELKSGKKPLVAAFDADGTLWDTDLGENFFQYTIDQGLVELPESPWNYYVELKKINGDPRAAYLWLAQIYKNKSLSQVRDWALAAFNSHVPMPIFEDQKELIRYFQSEGVEVYIVTASVSWAVEPGAKALGIKPENVIGVETQIVEGLITDAPKGIVTYRAGKAEALKSKAGIVPFFSAGNSEGDIELLEAATHLRIAVSAANRDDRLYKTEHQLQNIAKERNWLHHRFI